MARALYDEDEDSDLEIIPNLPESVRTVDLSQLPDEPLPNTGLSQKFESEHASSTTSANIP